MTSRQITLEKWWHLLFRIYFETGWYDSYVLYRGKKMITRFPFLSCIKTTLTFVNLYIIFIHFASKRINKAVVAVWIQLAVMRRIWYCFRNSIDWLIGRTVPVQNIARFRLSDSFAFDFHHSQVHFSCWCAVIVSNRGLIRHVMEIVAKNK